MEKMTTHRGEGRGDIVLYHMRLQDGPIEPLAIHKGRILDILTSIYDQEQKHFYHVVSLDEGMAYADEIVFPEQVVSIESAYQGP